MDRIRRRDRRHLRPAIRGPVPRPASPCPAAPGAGPARSGRMSNTAATAIAVLAALAAAASFGVAAALQHRQARLTPDAGGVRLLARLAAQPLWLAGIALAALAYGMQPLALAFGPLTLVAPIVATDLMFALPVAARWSRRPLGARAWLGCTLAAGGVAVFLAASPPSSGRSDAPLGYWALVFGVVGFVCVLALTV